MYLAENREQSPRKPPAACLQIPQDMYEDYNRTLDAKA
jgi:hypothetical protein